MAKIRPKNVSYNIGPWNMMRDLLIASMNKGQFPLAICALVYIVMIIKMPPADVSRLMFEVLKEVREGYLVGYILSAVLIVGWLIHLRWQRHIIADEMTRVANERNQLQQKHCGDIIESSQA